jgi:hypothetical protein
LSGVRFALEAEVRAIQEAEFILERIDKRWPEEGVSDIKR